MVLLKIGGPILTNVVWNRLLETTEPAKKKDGLIVTLENQLAVPPKGLHGFTQDHVRLKLSSKGGFPDGSLTNSSIKIERVIGLKKVFDELEDVHGEDINSYVFEDLQIPSHDKFLRYRITVNDFEPMIVKIIVLDQYQPGHYCFGEKFIYRRCCSI